MKKGYCENCNKLVEYYTKEIEDTFLIRGKKYTYNKLIGYCENCNEEITANLHVKTALKNKEKQANNFIIDNTAQTVSDMDILKQINEIYNSKGFLWIDKIYVLKGNKFIKVFKRK